MRERWRGWWVRSVGLFRSGKLAPEESKDNHDFGSGTGLQNLGALVGGGAGGEDVVNEEDGAPVEGAVPAFVAGEPEGVPEVLEPLVAGEEDLLGGGARAVQGTGEGQVVEAGEGRGNLVGLVEPAPLPTAPVEGDRDDDPIVARGNARVIEGLAGESAKLVVKMDAAAVFEGMDEFPGTVPGAEGGAGEVEGEVVIPAVRAGETVGDVAVGGESALLTEWGSDAGQGVAAGRAEVAAAGEGSLAEVAGRRVEEVEGPREWHRSGWLGC